MLAGLLRFDIPGSQLPSGWQNPAGCAKPLGVLLDSIVTDATEEEEDGTEEGTKPSREIMLDDQGGVREDLLLAEGAD